MPFGWKYRGVHTGLHFRLAHSFVGLGFCASVALRTASRPINVPFSSLSRFLSFYEFSQVLLGAPSSFLLSWTYRIDTMSAMCTEYIIPLFTLSRMAPAREVPAPPPARGVRTCLAHDFTSERPYTSRPRHRVPSARPLPQHAQFSLQARRRRPGRAPRTCSRTPPQAVASPQDEISLRNNLAGGRRGARRAGRRAPEMVN